MRATIIAVVALAVLGAALATPPIPTLPTQWQGTCNNTMSIPSGFGPSINQQLIGNCYFDGIGQRIRQDGVLSTPFGKFPAVNIQWYAQTYQQCVALQGSSDCSYFASNHIHDVTYNVATPPFGGGTECSFTFLENVHSPACTSDCGRYPQFQIPPFATYSSATYNNVGCDVWSWTLNVGPVGKISWALYVSSTNPTQIVHWEWHADAGQAQLSWNVDVNSYSATAPADSVFSPSTLQGCKLKKSPE